MTENIKSNQVVDEFLSLAEVDNYEQAYSLEIKDGLYFGLPLKPIVEAEKRLRGLTKNSIAYFSMEYGLATSFYNCFKSNLPITADNKVLEHEVFSNFRLADYFFTLKSDTIMDLPIYSGGLGVLAGDTVKTMADYRLPAVAIGVLWNTGYFRQRFWFKYGQVPEEMHWDPLTYPGLIPLKNKIKISLKSEDIYLRLWKYYVYSYSQDCVIPLILLDSNVEENNEKIRHLTDQLYRSDNPWIKLMQRIILGVGGIAALRELKYNIDIFHLNEGHAIFAFVESAKGLSKNELDEMRRHFVYTCHTPVEAGHDRFFSEDLNKIIKKDDFEIVDSFGREKGGIINLTLLSMNAAPKINAVSYSHQKVMHLQFPKYQERIKYVTNGVHSHTWISDRFKDLFKQFPQVFKDVQANPMILKQVKELRQDLKFRDKLWLNHQANKEDICNLLSKWGLNKDFLTICWARRVAAYKRPSMIMQDVERLIEIAQAHGPIQIIFAGKAHPKDNLGFTFINEMLEKVDKFNKVYDLLKIIMLENYDISLAKMLTSGVDIWLNNPLPPFEASGTSGMKAILNGVIQVSTLDGWVVEAEDKNIGKIFGYRSEEGKLNSEVDLHMPDDSKALYVALEEMAKLYYQTNNKGEVDLSSKWIDMMIDCIATGADFNTYRMLDDYKRIIWNIP
ncbi:MAG: alpha-glucan family phosphorylase [Candidatus Omnitrophota bacterium]